MQPRKLKKTDAQRHELEAFAEKYDTYALIHGDPVEVVFAIMARNFKMRATEDGEMVPENDDVALRAAEMLMSYRYPRVKASENHQAPAVPVQFNVMMQAPPPPAAELKQPVRPPMLTILAEKK